MRVVWVDDARQDLEEIYLFLVRVSQKSAAATHNKIYDEAGTLAQAPFSGPVISDVSPEHRALFVKPYYKIVYRIYGELVVVVAVWDCRKNPVALLQKIH